MFEPTTNTLISWADRVTYSILRILENLPSYRSPGSGTGLESDAPSTSSSRQDTSKTGKVSKEASNKRRREDSESGSSGGTGGSGGDPNKQPSLDPNPPSSTSGPKLRLACPYYKYDPGRYGSQRSCRSPNSWPSVHRLKYNEALVGNLKVL